MLGAVELARRTPLPKIPWRVATAGALLLTVPTLAFTATVLVVDNVRADGWTLARQNLGTLRGDADCGIGEELGVAPELEREGTLTYVVPDLLAYFPCVRQPRLGGGIVEAPRYVVSPFDTSGLETWEGSPFQPLVDLYELERVPLAEPVPNVSVFEVQPLPGAVVAPPDAAES